MVAHYPFSDYKLLCASAIAADVSDRMWLLAELVERTSRKRAKMQIIEIHAGTWRTASDFVEALKAAIGAPNGHGGGPDAFIDSMLYHDEINSLKAPYTIKISGLDEAQPEAQEAARLVAKLINEIGVRDWGTDLEIRMVIESANLGAASV
jgi:hypothetical protein